MLNRTQAAVIAVLLGFILLVCLAMVAVLFFPYEQYIPSTPAPTITPTATETATPTIEPFLPTAPPNTPVTAPTAPNTRVPTVTPPPERSPTPTVILQLPTPRIIPSATPSPIPTGPLPPTITPPGGPTPTVGPRQYSISFEAEDTRIEQGECTELEWRVQGALVVRLDGDRVSPRGNEEVCPDKDTTYELTIQLPDSPAIQGRSVTIIVEEPK
jgi:hypothetical protein